MRIVSNVANVLNLCFVNNRKHINTITLDH